MGRLIEFEKQDTVARGDGYGATGETVSNHGKPSGS